MSEDQKDRFIQYLAEQHQEDELTNRAMKLAVEEFQSIHDGVAESLANLQKEMFEIRGELSSERSRRKAAESKARKLEQQLKYVQKNRFGDKRQNARKKTARPAEDSTVTMRKTALTARDICLYQSNYPIDNNLAERTIRKLTTQRNSMLHFGSDEEVEMAAAYHSVISTVKLHGMSFWHFLGEFFQKIFSGCRDFLSMTPLNIGLAYSKC